MGANGKSGFSYKINLLKVLTIDRQLCQHYTSTCIEHFLQLAGWKVRIKKMYKTNYEGFFMLKKYLLCLYTILQVIVKILINAILLQSPFCVSDK